MPKVTVYDMTGKSVGEMNLSDAIFGIEPNTSVMHTAVVNYLANQRQGTQSTLTRTEVSGGGRKPWRQKGTGHARQGSIRAPQWRHGGIALGPKPRDYSYTINKKVKKLAIKSALSSKVSGNEMIVLDQITMESFKTKAVEKKDNKLESVFIGQTVIQLTEAELSAGADVKATWDFRGSYSDKELKEVTAEGKVKSN
jgi:large subunit ribosomal protein L4